MTAPEPPGSRAVRLRWAVAVLVVALLVGVGWLVWFSSVLAVSSVRVLGADDARSAAVLRAADVPLGVPLARVDTDAAQRRVADLPWVASVDVRRGWPREVVIAVITRVPIAALADGRRAVDADGVDFEPAGGVPKGLPRVSADGVARQAAMAVLAGLPPDLSAKVVAVSATTRDDVDLTLRSGDLVHWGSADQGSAKAEVLRALLKQRADVYDVSAPELPTTFRSRS